MLIVICGKSGSGKSTIVKEITNLGYQKIITDTTRPPRDNEVNEVDYYFDTEEEFDELFEEGEFIETTQYEVANGEVWKYGTTKGALREAPEKSVIILNPEGIKALNSIQIAHKKVLIDANETVILSRLQARGDWKSEIERRMKADEKDFADIHKYVDFTVYNDKNADIKRLAKTIIELVEDSENA